MLVDYINDVTITNYVKHPSTKELVKLAQLQDDEVGDGTISVVTHATELLKNDDELVKQKIQAKVCPRPQLWMN